jgi:hypothetical protein
MQELRSIHVSVTYYMNVGLDHWSQIGILNISFFIPLPQESLSHK